MSGTDVFGAESSPADNSTQDGRDQLQELGSVAEDAASPSAVLGENSAQETEFSGLVRDAIDDVVRARADQADASPAEAKTESVDAETEEPEDVSADPADWESEPFHKHPRFKKLIGNLQELRRYREETSHKVSGFEKLTGYMEENGLSESDVASGIEIMALMKLDPVEAWERLRPTLTSLATAAGEVLPEDLKGQVRSGAMSNEVAFQISRSRARENAMKVRSRHSQHIQQNRVAEEAKRKVVSAAGHWEEKWLRSDPDAEHKRQMLHGEVLLLHKEEGSPSNPEQVRAQLDKALQRVNKRVAQFSKSRKPVINPVTGGVSAPASSRKPIETMETIDIVRSKGKI
ncbi:hypothetical protein [Polycladidibacter hongkongensis]|uniref:hypothetical protein n=1 Tax=Polycladidibacter hongkongensis TaxID=1647556 RepID=UPI00082A3856|nr:hypothetical protein [Pseudovibrio hongkongensis]